jgi:transcriptional regulator with XRE-family HTH domain
MEPANKLGSLLRRLRGERNLTQGQLAEASGVSRTQIARLETGAQGKGRVSWGTITGLAKAFGVSADEFGQMLLAEKPRGEARGPGRPRKAGKPAAEKKREPKKKDGAS